MTTRAHLSPCPSCHAHLKAVEASCPFCGIGLAGGSARTSGAGVRRGVAAAAFFGVTAIAACAYGEPPDFDDVEPDAVEDVAADLGAEVDAVDGAEGDEGAEVGLDEGR